MNSNINLGNVIKNPKIRFALFALFIIAALVVGTIQVWVAATDTELSWLPGAIAAIAFLSIPFQGLAAANVPLNNPVQDIGEEETWVPETDELEEFGEELPE